MVAFGHTAVGVGVGLLTYSALSNSDPILGLIAAGAFGIISHFVADFIPHGHFIKFGDLKTKIKEVIIFDLALSLIIFLGVALAIEGFSLKFLYILFGIGGSQLPDVIDGLIYQDFLPEKGLLKLENTFHLATHWHGAKEKGLMLGIRDVWQVAVVILGLFFLMQ